MFFLWKIFLENRNKSWCLYFYSNKLSFILVWLCFPSQCIHSHSYPYSSYLFLLRLLLFKSTMTFATQYTLLSLGLSLSLNNIKLFDYSLLVQHSLFFHFITSQTPGIYSISHKLVLNIYYQIDCSIISGT